MVKLTTSDFQQEVLDSKGVVLVDFWAPWCGPCRMVAPVLEELGRELNGSVKITKVDVDENPELARQYDVLSIPTMIIFKDGKAMERFTGALPKPVLAAKLNRWIQ